MVRPATRGGWVAARAGGAMSLTALGGFLVPLPDQPHVHVHSPPPGSFACVTSSEHYELIADSKLRAPN
jgi:hypothetical protein